VGTGVKVGCVGVALGCCGGCVGPGGLSVGLGVGGSAVGGIVVGCLVTGTGVGVRVGTVWLKPPAHTAGRADSHATSTNIPTIIR